MAIISCNILGAKNIPVEEADIKEETKYIIYFGVFFDGTSNNAIQASTARNYRKKHSKNIFDRLLGRGRHEYEKDLLGEEFIDEHGVEKNQELKEASEIDEEKNKGYYKEGSKEKGFSNIAILHSKYVGIKIDTKSDNEKIIVYKIYVEGSGANDIKGKNGVPVVGLGFGLGKTGVVALVSKAVAAVDRQLTLYKNSTKKLNIELHFDIFGFSRGAACARLFAYLVRRNAGDCNYLLNRLDREDEFKKYYCKYLYKEFERLDFLTEYSYIDPKSSSCKTKQIDFLGIYDTVASIGVLRRKRNNNSDNFDENDYLNWKHNVINPLRGAFVLNRDFDGNYHDLNVAEYGLYSPQIGGFPTFQICAMDEFRENFAITDIGKNVGPNNLEIFLPGCHSDIGGGYVCNSTEKIVLNKRPVFSKDNFKKNLPGNDCNIKSMSYLCCNTPHDLKFLKKDLLSIKTFQELGWLPESLLLRQKKEINFNQKEELDQKIEGGLKLKENDRKGLESTIENDNIKGIYEFWEDDARVGFIRTVPFFFSNIPLQLMAKKASIVTGRKMFIDGDVYAGQAWDKNFYQIPNEIEYIYNDICNKCLDKKEDKKKGQRYWYYPGDGYNSKKYKDLRLKYLHFTSEQKFNFSRIWDVQNQIKPYDENNELQKYLICRIVYHGDYDDRGNMHFTFEYGSNTTVIIEEKKSNE